MTDNQHSIATDDRVSAPPTGGSGRAVTAEAKQTLETQVERFEQQLHELESGMAGILRDHDTLQEDSDGTRQLIESVRGDMRRAQRALSRIAAGTYGQCTVCGVAIAPARLEAIPAAERCGSCA